MPETQSDVGETSHTWEMTTKKKRRKTKDKKKRNKRDQKPNTEDRKEQHRRNRGK